MTHAPRIPEEQRGDADPHDGPGEAGNDGNGSAPRTAEQTGRPGEVEVSLDEQDRFGNLRKSLTNHWKVQDR